MTITISHIVPQEIPMREAIRAMTPNDTMVVQSANLAEHRSAAVNAYQTRKANPRKDGYNYNIAANSRKNINNYPHEIIVNAIVGNFPFAVMLRSYCPRCCNVVLPTVVGD